MKFIFVDWEIKKGLPTKETFNAITIIAVCFHYAAEKKGKETLEVSMPEYAHNICTPKTR